MERIRVLLVDDEPAILRGLRMRLELEPDVHVVAEARNGARAVELAARLEPQVVLMDLEMPVMNGIVATKEITRQTPNAAVVVLSLYDYPEMINLAQAAGAYAFVPKHRMNDELIGAIRSAASKGEEGRLETGRRSRDNEMTSNTSSEEGKSK